MLPTTNAEKKRAVDEANAKQKLEDKAAAAKAKAAGTPGKSAEKTKPDPNDGLNKKFDPEPELPRRKTPLPYVEPAIPEPTKR